MAAGTAVASPIREASMTLSLGDVARLAGVRRAVVSMWRSRSADTDTPFPAPCTGARTAGERFAAADIVDWLTATGRGNNVDVTREVVLHADIDVLDGPDPAPLQAVLALLALQAQNGDLPTDVEELLDLADEQDPDDELLLAELTACEALLPQLIPLAVELSEAAYGPAAAATALTNRRTRTVSSDRRPVLTERGIDVLRALVVALVRRAPDAVVCDVTGSASELLSELAESITIGAVGETSGPATRVAWRGLVTGGVSWRSQAAPTFTLLGLPSADAPALSNAQLMQTITDHRAACPPEAVTLVWGPAAALTDSITRDDRARTDDDELCQYLRVRLLTSGQVRAIVRLPAGLRPSRSRERLALWCLGPTDESEQPRTVVGDLADRPLDAAVVSGLVSDVLAGLDGSRGLRARELEVSEIRTARRLAEERGALVPPARRADPVPATAVLLDRYDDALEALAATPPPPIVLPTMRVRGTPNPAVTKTMSQLITGRSLGYRAGLRMTQAVDTDHGAVPVLDARSGAEPVTLVDRFDLNLKYPQLTYTNPGDVVFCTSGRPRAFVDREGGAVVRHPSRVLRCTDVQLLPEAVAAAINSRSAGETSWRGWRVPLVDHTDAAAARAGVTVLDQQRRRLLAELAAVDLAERTLLQLAAGGAVHLRVPSERSDPSTPGDHNGTQAAPVASPAESPVNEEN